MNITTPKEVCFKKTLVDLSFLKGNKKYYCLGGLQEGLNKCFYTVKTYGKNGVFEWKDICIYVYVHNGVVIKNATSTHRDDCMFMFRNLLEANGDYTKLKFPISYPLEVLH